MEEAVPPVAASLEEAGEQLLTFYQFPASQHLSLRTINAIERMQQEFRRRVKPRHRYPVRTRSCGYSLGCGSVDRSSCTASAATATSQAKKRLLSRKDFDDFSGKMRYQLFHRIRRLSPV